MKQEIDLVEMAWKLNAFLNDEHKEYLWLLAKECERLGATTKQIAPIYAALFLKDPKNE